MKPKLFSIEVQTTRNLNKKNTKKLTQILREHLATITQDLRDADLRNGEAVLIGLFDKPPRKHFGY